MIEQGKAKNNCQLCGNKKRGHICKARPLAKAQPRVQPFVQAQLLQSLPFQAQALTKAQPRVQPFVQAQLLHPLQAEPFVQTQSLGQVAQNNTEMVAVLALVDLTLNK